MVCLRGRRSPAKRENGSLPLEKPARLICEVTHKRCEITLEQGLRGESRERQVFYPENSDHLIRNLEWSISNKLARSLTNYHLFHAGSIARNGRGVLIPGTSGAGKSSTVAALALSGFDYCSDEVAVFGRDGRLRPFPKIISLKAGGWRHVAARKSADLSLVHEDYVHPLDDLFQGIVAAVNPEVHRVQSHDLGPGLHLVDGGPALHLSANA